MENVPDTIHTAFESCNIKGSWEEPCQDRNVSRAIFRNNVGIFPTIGTKPPDSFVPLVCKIYGRTIGSQVGMHSYMQADKRMKSAETADSGDIGISVSTTTTTADLEQDEATMQAVSLQQ